MIRKFIKRCYILTALFFCCITGFAQQEEYFQQEVNYKIAVTLDDSLHVLRGSEEILYTNNSKQTLTYIYLHLWPNAYKHSGTALGKQMLEHGKTSLYFSKENERGSIDSLLFRADGEPVILVPDPVNPDICKIILKKPLNAGEKVTITTPFRVKIPDAKFSRLGHTGQAYFITQWYPKPAVYDKQGWHPMPYLDQGEFYSEYGSFDVRITLPENYYLAATGNRQDAGEEEQRIEKRTEETKKFLNSSDTLKVKELMSFPPSSGTKKTVRFVQQNVHDFAWFADKRFFVLKGVVRLPGTERTVNTWAYFTAKNSSHWKRAVDYINSATTFYSANVGDYPYDHVTAVDGTIMAGGGMEYPNITVIGDVSSGIELDIVITHEVGHNWFYGILGSNERDYPFLDEGINSFFETRYCREKYPLAKMTELLGKDSTFHLLGFNKLHYSRFHEVLYNISLHAGSDQPLDLPSTAYSEFNYGSIIYSKTAIVCDYLRDVMGKEKFDAAIKDYFIKYKFRHPSPEDLYSTIAENDPTVGEHLSILFSKNDRVDYKFKSVKKKKDGSYLMKIKNKGTSALPFNVYALNNGQITDTMWIAGFKGSKKILFNKVEASHLKIDGSERMTDWNHKNNSIRTSGIFKKYKPLQLNFITKMEDPNRTQLNYLPVAGYNVYSHLMVGVSFHNFGFIQKPFQFAITPMFSVRATRPLGFADLYYQFHPAKTFKTVSLGMKAKSFAYDELISDPDGYDRNVVPLQFYYLKIAPYLKFDLGKNSKNPGISREILFTSALLFTDSLKVTVYNEANYGEGIKTTRSNINTVRYQLANKRALDPYRFTATVQQAGSMVKSSAALNYNLTFTPTRVLNVRFCAGAFLSVTASENSYYAFRASGISGKQDYQFEHNFLGRNEDQGLAFAQFAEEDGAMKVWSALGQSPEWMASMNVKSPRFLKFFRIYGDVVSSDLRYMGSELFLWDAGLNISVVRDIVEIYLPLIYSNSIKQNRALNHREWYEAARFTFNIHKLEPGKIIQDNFF